MQNTRVYLTPWTSGEESSRVQPVPSSFSISSRSLFPYFFPASPTPRVTPRDSQGARRVETICSPMINVLDWNGSISSWMNNCTCSFEAALTCINLWRSGMAHTYAALVGILRTWKVITWNLEIVESFRNGRRKDLSKFGGLKKKCSFSDVIKGLDVSKKRSSRLRSCDIFKIEISSMIIGQSVVVFARIPGLKRS